jgi:transcriptional regulator with GAF, ATPase, and Fis domain/Tfp pilus assembly protein PilF
VDPAVADLEMLADLYLQADRYVPALETIQRLLALPEALALSPARRASFEIKMITCRLAQGDCIAALAHCREVLQQESAIDSLSVRAALHLQCSEALYRLSRFEPSRHESEIGVSLADEAGDLTQSARALNLLGRLAYRLGELAKARDQYEQALVLYRRLGDESNTAHVRNNLGLIHKNLCEWDAAVGQFQAALEGFRRIGRFAETGLPHMNVGIVYQKSGDWDRALEHFTQAEQVFLQVADHLHLTHVAIGMGNIARLQRRFTEAESFFLGALERARSHDARREEVLALEFLGELEFDRGRPEAALPHYHEALLLAERIAPDSDLIVELERRRAEALCAVDRLDEAEKACERACRLARVIDERYEHAVSHRVAGHIAWAQGRRTDAIQSWSVAASLLMQCHERFELARTLLALGRTSDEPSAARRYLVRATALFAEVGSAHWIEEAERELHRLFGPPPPAAPSVPSSLLGRRHRAPSLVACSHAMQRVESLSRRAAATDLSVLVTGETGTGKELIARTIHGLSARAGRPFLAVNCGALRADLALSQLFGHRKGAFTGAHADGMGLVEAAHGGTLFLDEVGELPPDVQVTLLRFLESGEYLRLGETQVRRADVRIIAATNRDLRDPGDKHFRRDLLFRLNEVEIRLPALRERAQDILPLARHFLTFYGGMDGPRLTGDSEAVLRSHAWAGNVRELENVMKRVAALHPGGGAVDAVALLPFLSGPAPVVDAEQRRSNEREEILAAYRQADGNKSRIAELLGVSRKTLYARIKRLGIELP